MPKDILTQRDYYYTSNNRQREYGIYLPVMNRFLLVNNFDFWTALDTANILSSKTATMVYGLPDIDFDFNNTNCLEYRIIVNQVREADKGAMLRQTPLLKVMHDTDLIFNAGYPEDYLDTDKRQSLTALKEYAEYVHSRVFAINIIDASCNRFNTAKFVNQYVPVEWTNRISTRANWSAVDTDLTEFTNTNVSSSLKRILYLSNTPEEADNSIAEFWQQNYQDQGELIFGYYNTLNMPLPEAIRDLNLRSPTYKQLFIF